MVFYEKSSSQSVSRKSATTLSIVGKSVPSGPATPNQKEAGNLAARNPYVMLFLVPG
jgi:hypothetical protein